MKNILKLNQKIRLIPENYNEVVGGIIVQLNANDFIIEVEDADQVKNFNDQTVELSITTQHCLIKSNANIKNIENNKIYLNYPEEYKKIQRREYTRVDIKLPVKCSMLDDKNIHFETTTNNLSGGGMQIISSQAFPVDSVFNIKLELKKHKVIDAIFQVLRISKISDNEDEYYISGVFKKISNLDRISVIQLCFKRQLELRCIGLSDISPRKRR